MSRSIAARAGRRGQRGQALVVMVVAMIPALAMVGLIVDGGNAWRQQRIAQNGADAASEAGAVVLGQHLANPSSYSSGQWDANVHTRVLDLWRDNACPTAPGAGCDPRNPIEAYYTDFCGRLLAPNGSWAGSTTDAARVGGGSLPADIGGPAPDCTNQTAPGPVAGVMGVGHRDFDTFFARVVGIDSYTATTQATAVTGYLKEYCTGAPGDECALMPIAFYQNLVTCTASRNGGGNSGFAEDTGQWYYQFRNQPIVLPICKNGPGNVGWLDFGKNGVGGPRGIDDCVRSAASSNPCLPPGTSPGIWWDIQASGSINAGPLEESINSYAGQTILLPIFTLMCGSDPVPPYSGANFGCPSGNAVTFGSWQVGNSNPDWYYLYTFAPFRLEHAYTNSNNAAACNPAWSNPPADSKSTHCLIGSFVDFSTSGQLGPTGPGTISIQLIR